ncbi:sulfotransferase [uncultured Psychroserpens sp.]|uniref:sulfotransferase family protein n=1 Tax=uncultured Psychroserpens sp. TaxID=255436 RepID=UPI00262262B7|nr:sulfotransferase [uncultured Psychroserpens sp.]
MNNAKVDFFVVGAARSGTTSIYKYLSMHPGVFVPKVKECNFFSNVESLDQEVYEIPKPGKQYHMKIINSNSVYESLFSEAGDLLKGEVSPSYLWDKDAAKRIYDYNPDAKIIISLRNPIHRAYSHYLMHLSTGYEKETTFEDAIKADKLKIWGGGNLYLEMGLYHDQVKPYYDLFDKDNIKIIIYEDWTKSIENTMNDLYDFLSIDSFNDYDLSEKHNETVHLKNSSVINFLRQKKIKRTLNKLLSDRLKDKLKRNFFSENFEKQEIKPETYLNLKHYYKEDICNLESMIQKELLQKWS